MKLGLCRAPSGAGVSLTVAMAFPCQSCAGVSLTVAIAFPRQTCADGRDGSYSCAAPKLYERFGDSSYGFAAPKLCRRIGSVAKACGAKALHCRMNRPGGRC